MGTEYMIGRRGSACKQKELAVFHFGEFGGELSFCSGFNDAGKPLTVASEAEQSDMDHWSVGSKSQK